MAELLRKHKSLWLEGAFRWDVLIGLILFLAGLLMTYYANFYATLRASNPVTDIILDNLPVVNVNFLFTEGVDLFTLFVLAIVLYEPRRIPFILKSAALFIITRSFFIMLTHVAAPLQKSYIDTTDLLYKLSSGNDMFFSAHTGLPFLMAIIFWENKNLRYLFLLFTVVGGVVVLLGHLHYSIDVFSSLFIAFGVFHISKSLFYSDYRMFRGSEAVGTN